MKQYFKVFLFSILYFSNSFSAFDYEEIFEVAVNRNCLKKNISSNTYGLKTEYTHNLIPDSTSIIIYGDSIPYNGMSQSFSFAGDSALILWSPKVTKRIDGTFPNYDTVYIFGNEGKIVEKYNFENKNYSEYSIMLDVSFPNTFTNNDGYCLFSANSVSAGAQPAECIFIRNGRFYIADIMNRDNIGQFMTDSSINTELSLKNGLNYPLFSQNNSYRIVTTLKCTSMETYLNIYINGIHVIDTMLNERMFFYTGGTLSDFAHPYTISETTPAKMQLERIAFFDTSLSANAVYNLQPWELLLDNDSCHGEFTAPELYAILYDPPGDNSYSELSIDSTVEYTTSCSNTNTTSQTMPAGVWDLMNPGKGLVGDKIYKIVSKNIIGGTSETHMSTSTKENSFSTSLKTSKTFSSKRDDEFSQFMGPLNGTQIIIQDIHWKWVLARRLKNGLVDTIGAVFDDSLDYDYKLFQGPSDSSPNIRSLTLSEFELEYAKDTSFIRSVKAAFPFNSDGRLKSEMVDSGWIESEGSGIVTLGGNTPYNYTKQKEQTESYTYTWSVSVEESKAAKFEKLGFSLAEFSFSQSYTKSKTESSSSTSGRTASMTLDDNESWDQIYLRPYWDKRFGTYIVDVMDSSCSSTPFEAVYTKKSLDWGINIPDTAKSAKISDTLFFPISIINNSISPKPITDSLTVSMEIMDDNLSTVESSLSSSITIIKSAESTNYLKVWSGTLTSDTVTVKLRLLNPGHSSIEDYAFEESRSFIVNFQEIIKEIELLADTSTIKIPQESQMPVQHNFHVTIVNKGEQAEELEIGISDFSIGTTYQLSTLNNPVAAGDSAKVTVGLQGNGSFPFYADFYAQIKGDPNNKESIRLTIDTLPSTAISLTDPTVKEEVQRLLPYPNPVKDNDSEVNFTIPSDLSGKWEIIISDNLGNVMDKATFKAVGGTTYSWDLHSQNGNSVTNGIYILIARFTNSFGESKIIRRAIGVQK